MNALSLQLLYMYFIFIFCVSPHFETLKMLQSSTSISILNSDREMNQVGRYIGASKVKILSRTFLNNCKELSKIKFGKTEIFTQNQFLIKSIFLFCCIVQKQIIVDTWYFHQILFILTFFKHGIIFKISDSFWVGFFISFSQTSIKKFALSKTIKI